MIEHLEKQFVASIVSQYAEEVAVAHITCGKAVAMGVDVGDEVL